MKKLFTLIAFIIFTSKATSQSDRLSFLSYIFPSDSIKGFDEGKAKHEALSGGFSGNEYKVFMYRAKRNFVNEKYSYTTQGVLNQELPFISGAPCVNEDFEASPVGTISAISGWTITEGQNSTINGSCTMSLCCSTPATGNNTWIRTTPYNTFTNIGIIPNSPLGGTKVLQMNDNFANLGEVVRLTQSFPVTASNSLFQYAYMCQMDGSGHACCDNPYFNVLFFDCSNNLISSLTNSVLPSYSCALPPNPNWISNASGIFYHTGWQVQSVNLSAYIGTCVKVQVTVGDCDGWAHPGLCFFDAICSAGTGIEASSFTVKRINIYPNPSQGDFTIESKSDDVVTISNELGQTMKTVKLNIANNHSALINNLPVGIYFVTGNEFREKIIVTK